MKKETPESLIRKSYQSLEFLYGQIKNGTMDEEHVRVHLGLYESYFSELAGLLGYDSVLAKQYKERYAEIREKNEEIRRLKDSLMGTGLSAERTMAGLSLAENTFEAWYQALGFHYATLECKGPQLFADFSYEIEKPDDRDCRYGNKELFHELEPLLEEDHDRLETETHDRRRILSDTDANRKALREIYAKWLPGSRIWQFNSRLDGSTYLLCHKAYIPYTDLFALWETHGNGKSDEKKREPLKLTPIGPYGNHESEYSVNQKPHEKLGEMLARIGDYAKKTHVEGAITIRYVGWQKQIAKIKYGPELEPKLPERHAKLAECPILLTKAIGGYGRMNFHLAITPAKDKETEQTGKE